MMGARKDSVSPRFADLRARVVTALVVGGGAVAFLAAGGILSAILIAIVAGALVWEWRSITLHRGEPCGGDAIVPVAGVAGAVMLSHGAGADVALLALVVLAGVLAATDLMRGRRRADAGWCALGLFYLGSATIAFLWLREFDKFGVLACIWVVLVVAASDIGGYFAGRLIGGPKLWPRVSPGKTWAGAAGGVVLAFLFGGLFSWATTGTYYAEVCVVSGICAILAQAGDLGESALKRRFGVKDSGRLLPGHGGVLDRLDGLTAATLVVVAVTVWRDQTVFIWS